VKTVFCLGFFVVIFSSWDAVYPPIIVNDYKHAIELELVYSSGKLGGGFMEPGISFFERHKGFTCASMKVYSKDGVLLAEYPEDVITELKAKSIDDYERWVLNEKGIFLIPKACINGYEKYLEMLYATMKHNCGSKDATDN